MDEKTPKKFIDIDQMLRTKAPGPYRFIPRFVIRYLKRILHENDINEFLSKNGDKHGLDFANASLGRLETNLIVEGKENIPATGGYIFASIHPLGGIDGLALICSIGKVRSDIKFFVNENLMAMKNLSDILVPVNIYGKSTRQMLDNIDKIYSSDMALPIFPSGMVSRRNGPHSIKDLRWKKSFITQAKYYKKDIIPVWIEGKNSDFFYNFAKWRKRLGIKLNIEMFFLVNEMFMQKDKNIIMYYGKPVSYKVFDGSLSDAQWAIKFQDELYKKKGEIVKESLFNPTFNNLSRSNFGIQHS